MTDKDAAPITTFGEGFEAWLIAHDAGVRYAALTDAADRLDAAEFEDGDTQVTWYSEGQGQSRVITSDPADFIREIRHRV